MNHHNRFISKLIIIVFITTHMYQTNIQKTKNQTYKISLYLHQEYIGNVNFNTKNNQVFIDVIYLLEKFQGKNLFTNYWDEIEDLIIQSYKQEYSNQNLIIIKLDAKELDYKYDKLINKYESFKFIRNGKERIKHIDEIQYRIVPMIKIIVF